MMVNDRSKVVRMQRWAGRAGAVERAKKALKTRANAWDRLSQAEQNGLRCLMVGTHIAHWEVRASKRTSMQWPWDLTIHSATGERLEKRGLAVSCVRYGGTLRPYYWTAYVISLLGIDAARGDDGLAKVVNELQDIQRRNEEAHG